MIGVGGHPAVDSGDLQEVIRARAAAAPDSVAVSADGGCLTYRALIERSERLARRLRRAGAEPDSFVGVVADRSADTIVRMLGALMSGAAYVPMAPDLPADRLRIIASDAAIRLVTGPDAQIAEEIGGTFVSADPAADATDVPLPTVDPEHAAYAIFTSGSTGRPKGVVVTHRALAESTLSRFGVYPAPAAYAMLAPPTIDAAVAGIYFTLAAGGRLVLPHDDEVRDPQLLADLVVHQEVSHLDGLPSQYAALLRFQADALRALRCVVLGGETLPFSVAQQHLALFPATLLFNEYGPTESTVWTTAHQCTQADRGPLVPIGRPRPGVRVTVRGEDLRLVPPGTIGELCVAGSGLARGYLARPGLTAQRFVADPDPGHPGQRMYRTGDLAHVDESGVLFFHGRTDHLVKVRGFRVELGEVETRLLEHPDVEDVAVVAHQAATGVRLVAVVVPEAGTEVTVRDLVTFAGRLLPAYMIPALWRQVDALPLTDAGKVDRVALGSAAPSVGRPLTSLPVPR
ncbi:amino acid adenylation domain-containing protein [Micromonospora sp. NPDC051925]|uniref:amino acid adenylation domain-containing protein n=1 Tax=Micromonospora sp. NPDC051925 TaxID=3364288 RepID=UPI0037CA1514